MATARWFSTALVLAALGFAVPSMAQQRPDPEALMAAQREAMKPLALLDGAWRGSAWTLQPSGEKHTITQTERVGSVLDGSIKVIEGRGYGPDGKMAYNAFAIVSYDPSKKAYTIHSHAMGHVGDFAFKPTADGFTWEIAAGQATIRYTAVVKDRTWHEVGDRVMPGKDPVRFFEMTLQRIGDTDWPAGGAVPPK